MSAAEPHDHTPYDIDVEQALLGSILQDNRALECITGHLKPGAFYDPLHGRIFDITVKLIERGAGAVTPLTLHAIMKSDPGVIETGGQDYFDALRAAAPAIPNIKSYADILTDLAVRRRLVEIAEIARTPPNEMTVLQLVEDAQTIISELSESIRLRDSSPSEPYCLSLTDWLERPAQHPDHLLAEMLSTTSRMMLVAPTGLGKTNFSMAMGLGVASGNGFLHWPGRRSARVLFIDGEMSRRLMKSRLVDAARRHGSTPDSFFALCRDDVSDMPPLNTAAGQAFVDAKIKEIGGVDLIIFDSVMCLMTGDMKDEVSWQEALPWIRRLTQRQIGQVWVHHTGIEKSRSYGSSTREWQLDTVLLLEPTERQDTDIAFTLRFNKARERAPHNRADFEPLVVMLADDAWTVESAAPSTVRSVGLTPTEKGWLADIIDLFASTDGPKTGVPVSGFSARPILTRDQVRDGLKSKGRFTLKPDGALTGADRQKLSAALNNLKDKGKVGMTKDHVWLQLERQ